MSSFELVAWATHLATANLRPTEKVVYVTTKSLPSYTIPRTGEYAFYLCQQRAWIYQEDKLKNRESEHFQ